MSAPLTSLSQVQIGAPLRCQGLAVFPLRVPVDQPVDYQLADEAIASGTVVVEEVGQQGSVPELLVENKGDMRVLFLEGEQLVGAKQNRVLNTSVLIPARTKIKIPVSCVEHGRWRYTSPQFAASKTMSSSPLRYKLKSSVAGSLKASRGHRSDQGEVWEEVSRQQASLGVSSATGAMMDTYAAHQQRLDDFRDQLKYVEGSSGLAVALGPKVVAIDFFDKPTTCQKVWDRLLSGFTLDALESPEGEGQAEAAEVASFLGESGKAAWQEAPAVGEGQEYRTEFQENHGSALCCGQAPVHVSILASR